MTSTMTEQETPAYSFAVVERPKVSTGAAKAPNPFAETVAQMVKDESAADKAVSFVAPMGKGNGNAERERFTNVEKVKRQLRDAGEAHDVTIRTNVQLNTPKKGQATIAFWPTKKVTRSTSTDASTGDDAPADAPADGPEDSSAK